MAAALAGTCLWRATSFAALAVRPRAQQTAVERDARVDEETDERSDDDLKEFKDRLKVSNFTLEFSSGKPSDGQPGVTTGPPYVTCLVEYEDRTGRDMEGTVQAKVVLEQWVMKSDDDTIGRFSEWRRQKDDRDISMRFLPTSSHSLQDTTCIECVSGFSAPNAVVGTIHPSFVMTFSGLHHCLSNAGGGPGFCKSGFVAVPL